MTLRIHSLSQTQRGGPQKMRDLARDESAMAQALAKWKTQAREARGKPWQEAPEAMVADFARAVAQDLWHEYERHGVVKAMQLLACGALAQGQEHLVIEGGWPEAGGQVRLSLDLVSHQDHELGIEMDVAAPEDMAPEEVLDQLTRPDPAAPRLALDPLQPGVLPDRCVAAIVHRCADLFDGDDMLVLMSAAAVLLAWQQMEALGTDSLTVTMAGLHDQGRVLRPDQDVRLQATARLIDAVPKADEDGRMKRMKATFRSKPSS